MEHLYQTTFMRFNNFWVFANFFKATLKILLRLQFQINALIRDVLLRKKGLMPDDALPAFKELTTILCSEPIIYYPKPEKPYILITDTCQGDDGNQEAMEQSWGNSPRMV